VATRPTCTEICEPDRPHLITHVATTDAATADLDTVQGRHADLAACDPLPDVHLVDGGYVSVGQVLAADDDYGVQLTGPLPAHTSWQAGDDDAFDLTRFAIDYNATSSAPTARPVATGSLPAAATACPSSGPPSASPTAGPAPTGHAAPAPRTTPGT
jgi:hypothetical protein